MIKTQLTLLGMTLALVGTSALASSSAPARRAATAAIAPAFPRASAPAPLAKPRVSGPDSLTVHVVDQNNNPIPAVVYAIFLNNGNPSPNFTQIAFAGADGQAHFSPATPNCPNCNNGLSDTDFYNIIATTQGYTPGLAAQFNNGPQGFAAGSSNPDITIQLTATPGLGEIDIPVTNAAPTSLVFGQISLQAGGGSVQFSMTATDPSGNGFLNFYDMADAPGNTYSVGVFDPNSNLNATTPVIVSLDPSTQGILMSPLSIAGAPPPVTNISQSQQNGQGGTLSLTGVVTDTTTACSGNPCPIPNVFLNFSASYQDQYGRNFNDFRGANADQNGAFQLYGLIPGATYFTSTFGGCVFDNLANNGNCYSGFQDQPTNSAGQANTPVANQDILPIPSGQVGSLHLKLPQAPPSTGVLAVQVTDQFGDPFPQIGVNLNPDGAPWQTTGGTCNTSNNNGPNGVSNPGAASINLNNVPTGYALLSGLPSGNYNLQVYTSFGQTNFNAPNNSNNGGSYYQGNCNASGGPFYRLTIDTTQVNDVQVYDVDGNPVGGAFVSTTVVIPIATTGNGVIAGTLTFPAAANNLSASPILISVFPNCGNTGPNNPCPQGGGFKTFNSATTPQTVNYSIPVSTGYQYFMNVTSNYWGPIYGNGAQNPDLTSSTAAVINIQFVPGGRLLGTMRNPDGTAFVTKQNNGGGMTPGINANGNNGGGGTQINADGSFVLNGLVPGPYVLTAQAQGYSPFPFTTALPTPTVNIVANQDVHQDVSLVGAVNVRPVVDPSLLPPVPTFQCATGFNGNGNCIPENLAVFAYPSGTPITTALLTSMLSGSNNPNLFQFSASTFASQNNICQQNGNSQFLPGPGFCVEALPAVPAGTSYDFMLGLQGQFDNLGLAGGVANPERPGFTLYASSKNIVLSASAANSGPNAGIVFSPFGGPGGSTTPVENVSITPPNLASIPQAVLAGSITISNMITPREFSKMGGDQNLFFTYLPVISVYDSNGAFKGAAIGTPNPVTFQKFNDQFNAVLAGGSFAQWQQFIANATWLPLGYTLRGLAAGQTYNLVATNPNYPPIKTSVTLGAAGSVTTVPFNFDTNSGATIGGLVESTAAVVIAGAQVTVQSPGFPATTVNTAADGTWSLLGLSAGQYQVQAVAAGFAEAAEIVSVNASTGAFVAPAFKLYAGNASISGTVYTNNPICPPGATCSAFGKTVLQGVTVVAYDDTVNESSPTASLPLYTAVTSSSGVYTLNGLLAGDTFKVFVNDHGYYVLNQSTTALNSPVTGFDFALKPKPLGVNVFGYPTATNYEFQITNYQRFSGGSAWIGPQVGFSTGTGGTATQVNPVQRPDSNGVNELFIDYPLTSLKDGTSYILEIVAQPNDPTAAPVVSQTIFGSGIPNNACQAIDSTLLGNASANASGVPNNQASLDITGANASGLSLPVGGVIPSASTAVPVMCMNQTAANVSPPAVASIRAEALSISAFLSGVYDVTLSSINYVTVNGAGKGVNLTLAYNQTTTDIKDAAIFTYDQTTQKWQSVPGLQTIDPVRGTISVNGLVSLASVLNVKSAAAQSRMAVATGGHGFRPNAVATTDKAQFAILAPSKIGTGGVFSGTIVKVYNFPNPFNLQTKTVTLNTAAGVCSGAGGAGTMTTDGTVIKYEIPAGISGTGVIRIYTVSGHLVREIDAGDIQQDTCYYTTWDGRSRNGLPVANGVYYGILSVAGSKLSSGTFKLAVIK
ncbi:MAG: carboxypeptidase regulatory-like domain-containing protein [Elusimicrobiota bacterium]